MPLSDALVRGSRTLAAVLVILVVAAGLADAGPLRKGKAPPAVTWQGLDATEYTWESLREDQPLVLVFWATWCSSCKKEWPALQALRAEFADAPVQWATASLGEKPDVVAAELEKRGALGISLVDPDESRGKTLGLNFVPAITVLDGDGIVRYHGAPKLKKVRRLLGDILSSPLSPGE